MTPLLVDAKGAAVLLGISARSFLRLVARGEAPRPLRLGRLARWRVVDLEALVAKLAAQSTPEVTP